MNIDYSAYTTYLAAGAVVLIIVVILGVSLLRRRPKKLNITKFRTRWDAIQQLCANREAWPLAIINSDKLLDDALKQRRFKGKTMGERLVSAQHSLSENDSVWYGHKMRNKLVHEEVKPLPKTEVVKILSAFRKALKDLGAL